MIFSRFPYISLCKTIDPKGGAIFGPRAIILTNMEKVHKVMLHTKYQGSRPSGFRQEDFFTFSLVNAVKFHANGFIKFYHFLVIILVFLVTCQRK